MAGVLGDVELALDSFGEDAIEHVEDDVSEKTESVLSPPPGDFSTLKDIKLLDFGVVAHKHFRHMRSISNLMQNMNIRQRKHFELL